MFYSFVIILYFCLVPVTATSRKFGLKFLWTIGCGKSREQEQGSWNQKIKSFFRILHPMQAYKR